MIDFIKLQIQLLRENGWELVKRNDYYIFLRKGTITKKISLSTGNTVKVYGEEIKPDLR